MRLQAVKGMNDCVPTETIKWQYVESVIRQLTHTYSFQEIRFPLLDATELFKRSVGESTDIVEKEMFSFDDVNGDNLSLRPEGTAPCVRAGVEQGLLYNQIQKLWYLGPMFRRERPQKGRYRQFHQLGLEVFGIDKPEADVELLAFTVRLWRQLGLIEHMTLEINSIGLLDEREQYRAVLVAYFEKHSDQLDEDSQRRLTKNPLRILDSKNPQMKDLILNAPKLLDHLGDVSLAHFNRVKQLLDALDIAYVENPCLVRGLDYYCHTVFEWTTDRLGAQATVCAGGRYDNLVSLLGGKKPVPAVGFALGLERLILMLDDLNLFPELNAEPDGVLLMFGEEATNKGFVFAEKLRHDLPQFKLLVNTAAGSFKSQFKKADQSGARLAFIIGDDEVGQDKITVKYLRENKSQETLNFDELRDLLSLA